MSDSHYFSHLNPHTGPEIGESNPKPDTISTMSESANIENHQPRTKTGDSNLAISTPVGDQQKYVGKEDIKEYKSSQEKIELTKESGDFFVDTNNPHISTEHAPSDGLQGTAQDDSSLDVAKNKNPPSDYQWNVVWEKPRAALSGEERQEALDNELSLVEAEFLLQDDERTPFDDWLDVLWEEHCSALLEIDGAVDQNTRTERVHHPLPAVSPEVPLAIDPEPQTFSMRIYGVSNAHATRFGLPSACLLYFIAHKIQRSRARGDEDGSFRITLANLRSRHFPWLSIASLSRNLSRLQNSGVLSRETEGRRGSDRTLSYRASQEIFQEITNGCVFYTPSDALNYGVPGALVLHNIRIRLEAAAAHGCPIDWLVVEPSDLAERLPLSTNTIRRALNALVPSVLERRRNGEARCSEYRLAQETERPRSQGAEIRLLPEEQWRRYQPCYPRSSSIDRSFDESCYRHVLEDAQRFGDLFRQNQTPPEQILRLMDTCLGWLARGPHDGLYEIMLNSGDPAALDSALANHRPVTTESDRHYRDFARVILFMARFESLYLNLALATFRGLAGDNADILRSIRQFRLRAGQYSLALSERQLVEHFRTNHPPEVASVNRSDIEPLEKVRVFYAILNFRLRNGVLIGDQWQRYAASEVPSARSNVLEFFRQNPQVEPALLLDIHQRCQELDPPDDKPGYVSLWHVRRGHEIGFLVRYFNRIVTDLDIDLSRYEEPVRAVFRGRR